MLEADKADLDAILSLTTQKLLERRLQTKVRLHFAAVDGRRRDVRSHCGRWEKGGG